MTCSGTATAGLHSTGIRSARSLSQGDVSRSSITRRCPSHSVPAAPGPDPASGSPPRFAADIALLQTARHRFPGDTRPGSHGATRTARHQWAGLHSYRAPAATCEPAARGGAATVLALRADVTRLEV